MRNTRGGHAPPRFVFADACAKARARGWPLVMGIVNVTPDSFSDGGRFIDPDVAVAHALKLVAEGADILDVGGESTRPGAEAVSEQQEMDRVLPVVEALASHCTVPLSVDTSKPAVMRESVAAGAALVNDTRALREAGAEQAVADLGVPAVLMHMQGEPRTMQRDPRYLDVVSEVRDFLLERAQACVRAGVGRDRIALDPGFGFGKTLDHNLSLLRHLRMLTDTGFPVVVGLSRKSMIAQLLGRELDQRLAAGLALAIEAARRGAAVIRVHDVAETVDVLRVHASVERAR